MAARVIPPEAEVVGGPVPGITRVTTQPGYGGRDIGYSPILEPLGAQLRVPQRVLYRAVAEPELQRSRVFAAVGVVITRRRAGACACALGSRNPLPHPRSTIFANPDLVNRAPRSVTNTWRPSGQSRRSCHSALTSSPLSGASTARRFSSGSRGSGRREGRFGPTAARTVRKRGSRAVRSSGSPMHCGARTDLGPGRRSLTSRPQPTSDAPGCAHQCSSAARGADRL